MTKTAGGILLKGIGVRSNAAVSNRTTMPTNRLAIVKSKWPTRMNYPLKISQDRNSAIPKADKILCRQPPVRDELREDGFSNPRDHLDRHGCKHNAGDRRSDGRGR